MESSEQMSESPEDKKARWEKMTRARRGHYGLPSERKKLTPEETEKNEMEIKELMERLNKTYDYDNLVPELQEEWYWVEQEANAGEDRELAKRVLEEFLKTLEKEIPKEKTE